MHIKRGSKTIWKETFLKFTNIIKLQFNGHMICRRASTKVTHTGSPARPWTIPSDSDPERNGTSRLAITFVACLHVHLPLPPDRGFSTGTCPALVLRFPLSTCPLPSFPFPFPLPLRTVRRWDQLARAEDRRRWDRKSPPSRSPSIFLLFLFTVSLAF